MALTVSPVSSFNPASPGTIGGTTPAAITGTTITATTSFDIGASDLKLTRSAAAIAMISGDGTGTASGMTGIKAGNIGTTFSGIGHSNVTFDANNAAIVIAADGKLYLNSDIFYIRDQGGIVKISQAKTAGAGPAFTMGTAASAVGTTFTQTVNYNAAAFSSFLLTYTDTSSHAGWLPFQILGGAAGTTNLFKLGKSAIATLGQAGSLSGSLVIGEAGNVNNYITIGGTVNQVITPRTNAGGTTWQLVSDISGSGGAGRFSLASTSILAWSNSASDAATTLDSSISRISAGLLAIGNGTTADFSGSLKFTDFEAVGTAKIRALSTLVDGADGTNTSAYKFVSFVSNSAEAGNVIRVAQTSAVVFTTSSSRDLKNIVGDSDRDAAFDRTMAYRMRRYEWKSQPGLMFDGPIAEESFDVNPDPMLFPGGNKHINMAGYIPDLIMTVQRQQRQINELQRA